MSIVGDASEFLETYWQQEAKVFQGCISNIEDIVDGDELAGLACEEEIESRIITGSGIQGNWRCHHGPFKEADFATLGKKPWTLLVQGVDLWDEKIGSIKQEFDFLPTWRLEDVMVSYANEGGGVGPHFDNYDVFLIQVSGYREWQIGQRCSARSSLQDNDQVKLLAEFNCESSWQLESGDMIYVPAGVAHWGTALSDDCITLSVGFRSPSQKQLICQTLENLLEYFSELDDSDQRFYRDTTRSIDHMPEKINQYVDHSVQELLSLMSPKLIDREGRRAFGQLVTEPKLHPMQQENSEWKKNDLEKTLKFNKTTALIKPVYSRLAHSELGLFVNGHFYEADESFSRMICGLRIDRELTTYELEVLATLIHQSDIEIKV